jgi:hypothetical protein
MKRTTTNTFVKFYDDYYEKDGTKLVSIDSIMVDGYPIDAETGEDLEPCGSELYDCDGDPV